MKKIYVVLLLLGMFGIMPTVSAEFDFASAWKQWVQVRQSAFGGTAYTSPKSTNQETVKTTISSSSRNSLSYLRSRSIQSSVKALVTPIRPTESVHTITSAPIQIFKIGVQNTTAKTSTTFIESMLLDEATFRLYSNSGIAEDVKNIELQIAGETVDFDADGRVTVQFHNTRISRGDSVEFDVSIRIKDPSTTPHIPGTLRLRLDRMTAIGESSQKVIRVQVQGTPNSSQIVFDPVSTITGGDSSISGNTVVHISGGTLSAGEEAYVLAANFTANYDDLSVREITLRNTLTGSDIDSFIDHISAVNLQTGKVVATGRFSNGSVKLRLSPSIFVGRNQQARIGFELLVRDPIPSSSLDKRFQLDVYPSDVFVESKTTGRELLDSNKMFSLDSQPFSVSQGNMSIASTGKQYSFAVGTNDPETVFRFRVQGGSSDISLGRISFGAYPSGCVFGGGTLDASDVELVRINGFQEYAEPVNILASGNKITLDFPTEFYISRNNSVEFGLRLKLDDVSGNNDSDSIAIKIMGDSIYSSGSLSSVRATGSNFIWSDTSARMHSVSTTDWNSGYLVSGIPSNTVVVKRFGE